jgi:hypothetical protein
VLLHILPAWPALTQYGLHRPTPLRTLAIAPRSLQPRDTRLYDCLFVNSRSSCVSIVIVKLRMPMS